MELNEEVLPARNTKQGSTTVTVAAGKSLKIETTPGGEDILDVEVPAGETWTVSINVYVQVN